MEGGIAVLLLVILVVVAAVIAVAMYVTGGALWAGKTARKGDRVEGDADGEERPTYKRVTNPSTENTHLVGVRRDGEREE